MPKLSPTEQHELFLTMNVKLLVPYTKAKEDHLSECLNCNNIWKVKPHAISQIFKKYGTNSCPTCNQARRDTRHNDAKKAFLAKLEAMPHIEILSEYDGSQSFTDKEQTKVHFRNTICDHDFWCYPNYIINGRSKFDCIVCGELDRVEQLSERNESTRIYTDATKARDYIYLVASHTRKSYLEHKATINPDDLPIGLNGVEGAYQVDHIVSKAIGFKLGIPPELLSHPSNLQMLPWEENLAHKDKHKGVIPEVLKEFFVE